MLRRPVDLTRTTERLAGTVAGDDRIGCPHPRSAGRRRPSGRVDVIRAARCGRIALIVGAVVATLLGWAPPAAAHGGGGDDATNYLTVVLDAGDPGLDWEVLGGDALLRLTNRTAREVIVLGYEDEPYLRFTPDEGVFENVRSPATYLNDDRYADVDPPDEADPAARPEWRRVATGSRHAWHDHRAHWMSPVRPPLVDANPDVEQVILSWSLPLVIGGSDGRQVAASGELRWVPPVEWWPPVLVPALVFVAVVLAVAARLRPRGTEWRALAARQR